MTKLTDLMVSRQNKFIYLCDKVCNYGFLTVDCMMWMYCIMLLIDSLRNVVCVCLLCDIMVLYFRSMFYL